MIYLFFSTKQPFLFRRGILKKNSILKNNFNQLLPKYFKKSTSDMSGQRQGISPRQRGARAGKGCFSFVQGWQLRTKIIFSPFVLCTGLPNRDKDFFFPFFIQLCPRLATPDKDFFLYMGLATPEKAHLDQNRKSVLCPGLSTLGKEKSLYLGVANLGQSGVANPGHPK